MRIGQGFDVHAFAAGRKLRIGGVEIAHEQGLAGHSDADVLLHAICDALLGAASLRDIGWHFPDTDPKFANADSRDLLKETGKKVRAQGYRIVNIDSTIVAQAPRMAPHIAQMIGIIAADLGLEPAAVSVKATTTDHLGCVGRGEGIAAQAIVLIE